MRRFRRVVAIGLALVMALGIGIFGASELGGEIATLGTSTADGEASTRIWVVDDAGHAWLRAGAPGNGWLVRIDANPNVTVERNGVLTRYTAVPVRDDPTLRDRIHALMREKYTWADRIVSALRDGSHSVPIRLDPVEPGAAP
ncbi:MAG: hypothetical protein WEF50_08540 [Myxococcota bacterium]